MTLPDGWLQPAEPYLYWIPLSMTMLMGAPLGFLGGTVVRRIGGPADGKPSVISGPRVDMLLGGAWWSLSAILPSWGFPLTFFRSLGGAFLIAALYEGCLAVARQLAGSGQRE